MNLYVDIEKKCGDFKLRVKFETSGEVFAILGASGCGKSLTLKCIAGIEKPDKGRIKLGEEILFDSEAGINVPARKRQIGYLFQDYALFPHMTVLQNIMCGAGDEAAARDYIERFYLKGKENLLPGQLSGGECQRVAIARMLAARPVLVMFDEPFNALDSYLKNSLEREIMRVIDKYEGQALFVSHDRDEIYRMTDRIAVMERGSIAGIQEKHELFENPKTLAAALLTGCRNISPVEEGDDGSLLAVDWGIKLRCEDCRITAPRYVGFHQKHFEVADAMEDFNVIRCNIKRVVEDADHMSVQFTGSNKGGELTYTVDKERWHGLEGRDLCLRMPQDKIMMFP